MLVKEIAHTLRLALALWVCAAALPPAYAGAPEQAPPGMPSAPSVALQSGSTTIWCYLPDPEKGYYRGPRFDWSAMPALAHIGQHQVFGTWNPGAKYDPTKTVAGLVGEFSMDAPAGYEEAAPGETFVKIGVGELIRNSEKPYSFSHEYAVSQRGEWETDTGTNWVATTHTLTTSRGYGYRYTKRVSLETASELSITYTLENRGTKPLETTYYCHNFGVFGDALAGPGHRIDFTFTPTSKKIPSHLILDGNSITLSDVLPSGRANYLQLEGFAEAPLEGLIRYSATAHPVQLEITPGLRPYRMDVYVHARAICAEPFVKFAVEPRESSVWTDIYRFTVPLEGNRSTNN